MKTKITILSVLAITIAFPTYSQMFASKDKKALLGEINQHVSSVVSAVSYTNTATEVYNAMYVVATKEYNQMVRESEKKGYIEAKQETDTYKESATFEIRGDEAPYKVSFQVKKESRIKNYSTNTYGMWYSSEVSSDYYTKLQREVYELLVGKVELTKYLQDRINSFNSGESKDKNKILKGIDY